MLILFDIDGTLTTGGPARSAFQLALEETYGTAGPIATHDFSGKTDPRITRELLTAAGCRPRDIEAGLPRFWTRYLSELEARIDGHPVTVLPGVTSCSPHSPRATTCISASLPATWRAAPG